MLPAEFVDSLFNHETAVQWQPFPVSPQEAAYYSAADELFYGGSAGGGKSDLLLGLAGTAHRSSVIFRREFPRLRALIERSRAIYNTRGVSHEKDSFNESLHIWRLLSGRTVEFASIQYEADKQKQQGRPRDLYGFDEITEFLESQYRYVTIWNRSTLPGQRCRIVCTGNPPMDAAGEWVIQYWGAWLDPKHPNPAEPGELRWYATLNGRDIEVADNTPIDGGINPSTGETEWITPRSRTFIPARLEDNPILSQTGYRAVLQALGEPMRSQMLYGDFSIGAQDDAWQTVPTEWVTAAQERWQQRTKPAVSCRAMGVDPSRGGADDFVIARLYGNYFADPIAHAGVNSSDGIIGAKHVTDAMGSDNPPVFIDVIGIGSSVYDHLKVMQKMNITPVNVGAGSSARDKTGRYEFANLRSEQWWQFREALDPNSGEDIALPPSRQLRVDLCAPRYQIRAGKIVVESKPDVKKRIGRSTDYADPHLLAWHGVQTGRITTAYPDYD
jgi:hypothetical protein